ncbi:MAG: Ribonuclease H [Phycisphaerae bacterium]|nr:Ribonuclease H [Phycisphaerae bacterium]
MSAPAKFKSRTPAPLLRLYVDGGSRGNPGPAGGGVVLADERDAPLIERGLFFGHATNNVAEYRALLGGLELATQFAPQRLEIFADSQLMVRQITGEYRVKSEDLIPLHEQAQLALLRFDSWQITHVRRERNARADKMANLAMNAKADVVDADSSSSCEPQAEDRGSSTSPSSPRVLVRVTLGCDPRVCDATMMPGETFEFGQTTPGGLCVYAAQGVLNAAVGLFNEADVMDRPADKPLVVTCQRPGCGARFEVALLPAD